MVVRGSSAQRLLAFVLSAALLGLGCASPREMFAKREPLRVSDVAAEGDPTRRASMRLVSQGLASDSDSRPRAALSEYERAIQVDPTNPYAYLAMARHYVEVDEPARALESLDQAEALLDAEGLRSPRVEAHLLGLRGAALSSAGRGTEADPLLSEARVLAPSVWGDASLSADELR